MGSRYGVRTDASSVTEPFPQWNPTSAAAREAWRCHPLRRQKDMLNAPINEGEMIEQVGTVAGLWRYPVKSLLGEELSETGVGEGGLSGDRAYALLDARTDRVLSAKNPKRWPGLFRLQASYVTPPRPGHAVAPVRIATPGGESFRSDDPDAATRLSAILGGDVRLVTQTPGPPAVEVYTPPLDGLLEEEEHEFRVPPGPFHDSLPIHIVTTSTLARLQSLYPAGRFDVRRFRPNVLVATENPPGFVEQAWIGTALSLGDASVHITKPCSRCVMTTLPQTDLPEDRGILRTVVAHADGDVGVKGHIAKPGRVRIGDPVLLG